MAETADKPGRGSLSPAAGSGVYPRLLGGRLCLDFANTVENLAGPAPEEFLRGYPDLAGWGRHAGILTADEADRVLAAGKERPEAAAETFSCALALRSAIYGVFLALAEDRDPEPDDLVRVETEYATGLGRARLVRVDAGFDWRWPDGDGAPDRVAWEAARSAVELLREEELGRVRRCPGPDGGCGWLFYDESKNGSRRWCSMEGCGSHAKMRRYRARRRPTGS